MIRSLLGLHPAAEQYLSELDIPQIAKLIYRDHVSMKHANRKRLASEMAEKSLHDEHELQQEQQASGNHVGRLGDQQATETTENLMSKLLVKYLMEVTCIKF